MDLTTLVGLDISSGPKTFESTLTFTEFGSAHNIFIHEDSGTAYVVGSDQCEGGLYMVNITDPSAPAYVNCFEEDGYNHDVQCK